VEQERDPPIRAWSHLLGAHALGVRAIEQRLTAAGQPPLSWYDVLLELARAGGRLRVGELGERLVVEPHNVTRLLDRLEAEGLLRRQRAPGQGVMGNQCVRLADEAIYRLLWPTAQTTLSDQHP
jgi:hypothetical protein